MPSYSSKKKGFFRTSSCFLFRPGSVFFPGALLFWSVFFWLAFFSMQPPSLVFAQNPSFGSTSYLQAVRNLRARNYLDGEWALLQLARQSPPHFRAYRALSRFYLGQRKIPDHLSHAHFYAAVALRLRPASDVTHDVMGQILERQGKPRQAASHYRSALHYNPSARAINKRLRRILRRRQAEKSLVEKASIRFEKNPSLASLTLFGRIVMKESPPEEALVEFGNLRPHLSKLPEIHLWIARAERKRKNLAGEINAYQAFLARNPKALGVRLLLLERLLDTGRIGQVQEELTRIQKKNLSLSKRERGKLWLIKSGLLAEKGQGEKVAKALQSASQLGVPAKQIRHGFQRALEIQTENGELWLKFAHWLRDHHRRVEAVRHYVKAAKSKKSLLDDAMEGLESLKLTGSASYDVYLALGELAYLDEEYKDTLEFLEKIPPDHPRARESFRWQGFAYHRLGKPTLRKQAFYRYIKGFGTREEKAMAQGRLDFELGNKAKAVESWLGALAHLGGEPEILKGMISYLKKEGRLSKETSVRRMLKRGYPMDQGNLRGLALALEKLNRSAESLAEWEALAQRKKTDASLWVKVSGLYRKMGQEKKALSAMLQASRIQPLSRDDTLQLAGLLEKENQYAESLELYWQVFQESPDHQNLRQALPRLVLMTPAPAAIRLAAAKLAMEASQFEVTLEILEDLVRLYPLEIEGGLMLGRLLLAQKAPAEAERVLLNVSQAQGRQAQTRLELLAQAQRTLGSLRNLMQTLAALNQLKGFRDEKITTELGVLYAKFSYFSKAKPLLEKSWEENDENGDVALHLARVKSFEGDPEGGILILKRLLSRKPGHTASRAGLIRLLTVKGSQRELAAELEIWVQKFPQDREARHALILAYLREFQAQQAFPHYQILKKLDPGRALSLIRYFKAFGETR